MESESESETDESVDANTTEAKDEDEANFTIAAGLFSKDGSFSSTSATSDASSNQLSGNDCNKAIREVGHKISNSLTDTTRRSSQTLVHIGLSREKSGKTKQQAQAESKKALSNAMKPADLQTVGVLRDVPDSQSNLVECYCNSCNARRFFSLTEYPKRAKEIMHSNGGDIVKVIAEIYRGKCTECHSEQELSPHETTRVQLLQSPEENPNVVRRFQHTSLSSSNLPSATVDNDGGGDKYSHQHSNVSTIPTVVPTVNSISETADKADKYGNSHGKDSTNPTVNSTVTSTTDLKPKAVFMSKDKQLAQAWAECSFEKVDELIQRNNLSYSLRNKVSSLANTIKEATKHMRDVLKAIADLPDSATAIERSKLYTEISELALAVKQQQGYLDEFANQFDSKLTKSHWALISKAQRRLENWRMKLIAIDHKNSPDTVNRDCSTGKVFWENGIEILHPLSHDAEEYGYIPAFSKCQVTVGMMTSMITLLSELSVPKSGLYKLFAENGLDLTKQQSINWILGFARAYLHPAAEAIKESILHNSDAVLMYETTLKVHMSEEYIDNFVKSQQIEQSNSQNAPHGGLRRFQVWTLVSSWTSPVPGAYCMLSESRNHMIPFNLLKEAGDSVGFLTTDGYKGYNAAIKKLQEIGKDIKLTPCLTHLRRPLHQHLEDSGLLKVYNEILLPSGSNFYTDFEKNLNEAKKTHPALLSGININMLWLYYLTNSLYAIDTSVLLDHMNNSRTDEFKQDLKETRQCHSAVILECIYDIVFQTARDYPDVLSVEQSDDGIMFKANPSRQEGKILLSFISCKANLQHFIDHPEVELSVSVCERVLGPGVLAKKSFYILRSSDGGEAFCDFQTLFNTCRLNNVPFHKYVPWLVANINYRLSKMPPDPTIYRLPSPKKLSYFDKDGNEHVKQCNRYDKENRICYDKVDMRGLHPHDYARYIREYESKNNSNEGQQK